MDVELTELSILLTKELLLESMLFCQAKRGDMLKSDINI